MRTGTRCVRDTDKTDKHAHIERQAAAAGGPAAPHSTPSCRRTAGADPHPARGRLGGLRAPGKRPSRLAPRLPDAASPHCAEATQTPLPRAVHPPPPSSRGPRPPGGERAAAAFPRTQDGRLPAPQGTALLTGDPREGTGAAGVSLEKLRRVHRSRRVGRRGCPDQGCTRLDHCARRENEIRRLGVANMPRSAPLAEGHRTRRKQRFVGSVVPALRLVGNVVLVHPKGRLGLSIFAGGRNGWMRVRGRGGLCHGLWK